MNKVLASMLLAFALAPAIADANAGRVLFALGRVDIQRDGVVIPAARGMVVQAGDRFELGPTGRTQLRMTDGAMIALQPNTSFIIEDYQAPAPGVPAADDTSLPSRSAPDARRTASSDAGRALFSLLKGGFRTITGLIGKGDQDSYQLKTPVATIGIRGTTYSATYCPGTCGSAPSGLYVGVSSGQIVVSNDHGDKSLGEQQYGYVKDENTPPEQTLEPPADVLDPPIEGAEEEDDSGAGDDASAGGAGSGGAGDPPSGDDGADQQSDPGADSGESGGEGSDSNTAKFGNVDDSGDFDSPGDDRGSNTNGSVENRSPEVPDSEPTVVPSRLAAYAVRTQGGQADNEALRNDSDDIVADSTGLRAFQTALSGTAVEQYAIGSAQNVNQGFDPATSLRWGRWSGGAAQAGANALDLAQQSLHWILGPTVLQQPVLPVTGSATYQLVGNTDPTDNAGNIGFLGSAQFSANFTVGTVSNSLSLGINNQVWTASGTANISPVNGFPAFAGGYSSVNANGQTGTGGFAGFFVGPSSGGVPAGAGLTYSLQSGAASVSGAAAFGNPTAGAP